MTAGREWKSWRWPSILALAVGACLWLLWRECGTSRIEEWRETDTQAIARNFALPGANIFYPRVDWGGRGPGYVETEFQLYTFLVAQFLKVFGDVEWPGRLLSLLATAGTAAIVFRGLSRMHGDAAAAIATVVALSSRGVMYVATAVQPEALCLMLYAAAWFAWLEFERSNSSRALGAYALFGALAMLVKPTAAQLGIASFLLLFLRSRERLRKPKVWLVWLAMLVPVVAHLWHGRNVYLEYGNTFGVLSGGDSKLPRLEHLFSPHIHYLAAKKFLHWGTGVVGALAIVAAFALRRNVALLAAQLAANAFWTVLALRYTSDNAGNHYHLMASLPAAHAAALVVEAALQSRWRRTLTAGLGLVSLAGLSLAARYKLKNHVNWWNAPAVAAGAVLSSVSTPGDLVVIRSVFGDYDPVWRTPNNFQDPRVFYLSRTRGWAVGSDDTDPKSVSKPAEAGARFYVEVIPRLPSEKLDAWLSANAKLLHTTEFGGKVYGLGARSEKLD